MVNLRRLPGAFLGLGFLGFWVLGLGFRVWLGFRGLAEQGFRLSRTTSQGFVQGLMRAGTVFLSVCCGIYWGLGSFMALIVVCIPKPSSPKP